METAWERLYFVLDENNIPIATNNILEWGELFNDFAKRRVALTFMPGYEVSTVFLGLDHSFGEGPPLLWETMVFKGGTFIDIDCNRYSSIEDAKAGHEVLRQKASDLSTKLCRKKHRKIWYYLPLDGSPMRQGHVSRSK